MDQESIVYGCIKDVSDGKSSSFRISANRDAILCLPGADEWSFIYKDMFSLPIVDKPRNSYQTDVIHFGASYKAIEYEWAQWIAQFEALLNKMYWMSATVHLETEISGIHTFTWQAKGRWHEPGSQAMNVKCEWSREGALQF